MRILTQNTVDAIHSCSLGQEDLDDPRDILGSGANIDFLLVRHRSISVHLMNQLDALCDDVDIEETCTLEKME